MRMNRETTDRPSGGSTFESTEVAFLIQKQGRKEIDKFWPLISHYWSFSTSSEGACLQYKVALFLLPLEHLDCKHVNEGICIAITSSLEESEDYDEDTYVFVWPWRWEYCAPIFLCFDHYKSGVIKGTLLLLKVCGNARADGPLICADDQWADQARQDYK